MPRVYIANYSPTNDYSTVAKLGELIYCTEGIIKKHETALHQLFKNAFVPASDADYLLLTGSQMVIAVAYHEWCKLFPNPSILVWDKFRKEYVLKNILT